MKTFSLLGLLLLIGLLTGCKKNCGPSDEPRLLLYINTQATTPLTDVYALNAVTSSPTITLPQSTSAPNRLYWQLNLPLNLNADSVQYVLTRPGRRDTVTVNYRRMYAYEDTECGYTVTILPPITGSSLPVADSLIVRTTTGKLNFVNFTPTTSRNFFSSSTNTGINVGLLWL
ncbi:hypothetical protein [Fibrella arboris]|uniref:hypothetical protein n=1 Tax=Fibrella arboris TaxID=3242486 RepID=UPI003522C38E